jgi:hypothetical protein
MSNQIEQVMAQQAAPAPAHVGQATAIEQSRAVAEVQAAVVVAQQVPRNVSGAIAAMRESCQQKLLAERAFFRYSRGGSSVNGATIHLARELARCWGNVQYGIAELSRDLSAGKSEMVAYAWDVQTNTRTSTTFIVPHGRDTKDGFKSLIDMRDVYENNANMGARRVREMIFAILPPYYVEEAKTLCNRTLQDGGGVPLAKRIADSIAWFESIGVIADQLETKLGRARDRWTAQDVAQLGIIFKAIDRGEVHKDEEFAPPVSTPEQILAARKPPAPAAPAAEEPPAAPPAPEQEPASGPGPDDEADAKRDPIQYTAEEINEMGGAR